MKHSRWIARHWVDLCLCVYACVRVYVKILTRECGMQHHAGTIYNITSILHPPAFRQALGDFNLNIRVLRSKQNIRGCDRRVEALSSLATTTASQMQRDMQGPDIKTSSGGRNSQVGPRWGQCRARPCRTEKCELYDSFESPQHMRLWIFFTYLFLNTVGIKANMTHFLPLVFKIHEF